MENNKTMKCKNCGNEISTLAVMCPACGATIQQQKKKKRPIALIVILGIVVWLFILGAVFGNNDSNNTANTSSTTSSDTTKEKEIVSSDKDQKKEVEEEQIEYIVTDAETMVSDLDSNALKAEDTYNNQYVEVTGKLRVIDSSGKYITIYPENNDYELTGIQCYIKNDDQKAQVMEMSKGDIVTIRGKITMVGEVLGYSLDITEIK